MKFSVQRYVVSVYIKIFAQHHMYTSQPPKSCAQWSYRVYMTHSQVFFSRIIWCDYFEEFKFSMSLKEFSVLSVVCPDNVVLIWLPFCSIVFCIQRIIQLSDLWKNKALNHNIKWVLLLFFLTPAQARWTALSFIWQSTICDPYSFIKSLSTRIMQH